MFVQFCNYSWNAAGAYTVGQSKFRLIFNFLFDVTVSVSSSWGELEEQLSNLKGVVIML